MVKIKSKNPKDIRRNNTALLLQLLRKRPYTLGEAATRLKLSTTAISNIAAKLCDKGLVTQSADGNNSVGRPPVTLRLNAEKGYFVLVNLLTSEEAVYRICFYDFSEKCVFQTAVPTHAENTDRLNESVLSAIADALAANGAKKEDIFSVFVAAPGVVNRETGDLEMTYLQTGIGAYNVRAYLAEALGVPVTVKTQLYLTAKAEARFGKLKKSRVSLVMDVSAGIGMMLMIDGVPFEGAHGYYGEIGLMNEKLTARPFDVSGGRGCLDDEFSLAAVKRRVAAALGREDERFSYAEFFAAAEGDGTAGELFADGVRKIAHFLENVFLLLDPDTVAFVGYVRQISEKFLRIIRETLSPQFADRTHFYVSGHTATVFDVLADEAIGEYIERYTQSKD